MKNVLNKRLTTILAGIITLILLTTTLPVQAQGTPTAISQTYTTPTPTLGHSTINGQIFDTITLPDSSGGRQPGEPDIPASGASLLIPQGTTITSIDVTGSTPITLGPGYHIQPVQTPVTLDTIDTTRPTITYNTTIYHSTTYYPTTLYNNLGVQNCRGYSILELQLNPIQYQPTTGGIRYYPTLTVTIHLTPTTTHNILFRGRNSDEAYIHQKVDNPTTATTYTLPHPTATTTTYKLLIITTDALKSHFQPLADAHNTHGLPTEIKTLSDITPLPSKVTPSQIRDFIRSEYLASGIEYVLIGGDDDVVPVQKLYCSAYTGGTSDQIPSDLYYACLDGTYDYNANGLYGEPKDGNGGSDVDLFAEVAVGRACVSDAQETDNFVTKTVSYINGNGIGTGPILMSGEFLWDPSTFGDDYMEEMVNGSRHNGYTTVGFNSSVYTIDRLYDQLYGYPPGWPSSAMIDAVNQGVTVINHLGHSNPDYNMRISSGDVDQFTNTILPFVYSQGCDAGAFDEGDCIAEHWTVKTQHAGVAVIMCARYGWGVTGSTNGANQRYHRYFWDAVFARNITSFGWANQDSKERNIRMINGGCMRWVYYEMNLFGDPSLQFFPTTDTAPLKPVAPTGVSKGVTGTNYNFTAVTTDSDGDKVYYKFSFGDGTYSAWLGPFTSGEPVTVMHNWTRIGSYSVQVRAMDTHRMQSDWSDPSPIKMPYVPWWATLLQRILAFFHLHFA